MVGNGVGAGAGDLAEKKTSEATRAFELAFLLIIDVEQVEFAGAISKLAGDALEQAAQDGRTERVEEEE